MSLREWFSTIVALAALSVPLSAANQQMTLEAARDLATNAVRVELRSRLHFKSGQFLGVQRDEELEQALAIAAVGWRAGPVFIYKVSPEGIEIRENAIVHHVAVDGDPMFIVAVSSERGSIYRIHGFGAAESLAEFGKLIDAAGVRVSGPDQAEALAGFYRKVNPENHEGLAPITKLIELKQAAERQCQSGERSFDADEEAFTTWWKRAQTLYAALRFDQRAVRHGSGYLVEWVVLSSPSNENCGGAPLRAQMEVSSDGHVGRVTFSSLQKG